MNDKYHPTLTEAEQQFNDYYEENIQQYMCSYCKRRGVKSNRNHHQNCPAGKTKRYVYSFVKACKPLECDLDHTPNAKTIAAMNEECTGRFKDFNELLINLSDDSQASENE